MNTLKLSICIPTYNFGAFIGDTLTSITDQAGEDIEIVVVDGGSTDNTADVVRRYQRFFPRLAYHRLEKKGGIDKDLATTVELATGDYCWLLSSDDVLKPGAIGRILREIASGFDVYLCNRTECDRSLMPLRDSLWLAKNIADHTFTFSGSRDFLDYFHKSRSIGALFSYISAIIVKRARWNEVTYNDALSGTNYAHVARLISMLQRGGVMKYIRDPLVLCRGENDSFAQGGIVRRFLIDLDGYLLLAATLFSDAEVRQAFLSVMRHRHKWYVFTKLRSEIDNREHWNDFERRLIEFGYSRNKLCIVRTLGSSKFIMIVAHWIWSTLKKITVLKARIRSIYGRSVPGISG
jgi:abequosyltransferase